MFTLQLDNEIQLNWSTVAMIIQNPAIICLVPDGFVPERKAPNAKHDFS